MLFLHVYITTFRIKEKNYLIYPTPYIPTFLPPILFSVDTRSGWWFLGLQPCFCVRWLSGNCEMKLETECAAKAAVRKRTKATQADPQLSTLSAVWRLGFLQPQIYPHSPLSHKPHTPLEAKHIS